MTKIAPERPDWLDGVLQQAATHPIPDDGFTDRVLARLPPPPPRVTRRNLAILLFTLLAGLVGTLGWPGSAALWRSAAALLSLHPQTIQASSVAALALLLTLGFCGVLALRGAGVERS